MAHRALKYRGDKTAPFDKKTGTGTVGKVIGSGRRWFTIVDAVYDPETDTTTCRTEGLVDPNIVLANRHVSEEWHE